jgi:hypothetical protein
MYPKIVPGFRPLVLLLSLLAGVMAAGNALAELIFSAPTGTPSNPGYQIFRATGGNVVPINTGLPSPLFPSLSPDGQQLLVSAVDPAQPNEASQDLFAMNLQNGQVRRLVDNVTQSLPDGGFIFATPIWSAMSSSAQRVAFVNQLSGTSNDFAGGSTRQLSVISGIDGTPIGLAELGHGNAFDLFQSEFVGLSFIPNSDYFATPAYVQITNNVGHPLQAAGIVLFGPEGPPGQPYVRTQVLTVPTAVYNLPLGNTISTHALPAFSPNGSQMAFFRITFPNPLMTEPAQTDLIVISMATGNGSVIASFEAGWYPAGLSWAGNNNLVMALGQQLFEGGTFLAAFDPFSAQVVTIPAGGGMLGSVTGVSLGMFPNALPPAPVIFSSNFEG